MLKLRRKPEEAYMKYNMRTSAMISTWLTNSNLFPAHVKVIKSVYKAAWREKNFVLDNGDCPLSGVRSFRDATWWAAMQYGARPHKRRKLGVQHARPGTPRTPWEQPFVDVWGEGWRAKLRNANTLQQWMAGYT
eukprot:3232782-Karenia_brevis.AAC.1